MRNLLWRGTRVSWQPFRHCVALPKFFGTSLPFVREGILSILINSLFKFCLYTLRHTPAILRQYGTVTIFPCGIIPCL